MLLISSTFFTFILALFHLCTELVIFFTDDVFFAELDLVTI